MDQPKFCLARSMLLGAILAVSAFAFFGSNPRIGAISFVAGLFLLAWGLPIVRSILKATGLFLLTQLGVLLGLIETVQVARAEHIASYNDPADPSVP
ncbi:MAG: hypothetical protein ACXWLH_02710 [Candidatus Saccharimonadales bacterium]